MLRKLFALTEQGAKDMKKGIIASVFTSLSLMLPMGLLLMLVMQLLQPLLGMEATAPSLGAFGISRNVSTAVLNVVGQENNHQQGQTHSGIGAQ